MNSEISDIVCQIENKLKRKKDLKDRLASRTSKFTICFEYCKEGQAGIEELEINEVTGNNFFNQEIKNIENIVILMVQNS